MQYGFNKKDFNSEVIGKINICNEQLSNERKAEFGFDSIDSIIEVTHHGYGFCNNDEILFTSDFENCFVFFIYDSNNRLLFHADSTINIKEILKIIKKYPFDKDIKVIVSPGIYCFQEDIEYKKIIGAFMAVGFSVSEYRIPFKKGFVIAKTDEVLFGSLFNDDYLRSVQIGDSKRLTYHIWKHHFFLYFLDN